MGKRISSYSPDTPQRGGSTTNESGQALCAKPDNKIIFLEAEKILTYGPKYREKHFTSISQSKEICRRCVQQPDCEQQAIENIRSNTYFPGVLGGLAIVLDAQKYKL